MAVSPATTATAAPGTPLRATMPAASWSNAGSARRTAAAAATRRAAAASAAACGPEGAGTGVTCGAPAVGAAVGVTDGEAEGGAGVSAGVAGGDAGADATTVAARDGEGDGSAATRMPQPASSVAAPAAASTLARHLGLTSASSILAPMFAAAQRHTLAAGRV